MRWYVQHSGSQKTTRYEATSHRLDVVRLHQNSKWHIRCEQGRSTFESARRPLIKTGGPGWEMCTLPQTQEQRTRTGPLSLHSRASRYSLFAIGYSSLSVPVQMSDGSSGLPFQLTSVSVSSPTPTGGSDHPIPTGWKVKEGRPSGNVRQVLRSGSRAALRSFRTSYMDAHTGSSKL